LEEIEFLTPESLEHILLFGRFD